MHPRGQLLNRVVTLTPDFHPLHRPPARMLTDRALSIAIGNVNTSDNGFKLAIGSLSAGPVKGTDIVLTTDPRAADMPGGYVWQAARDISTGNASQGRQPSSSMPGWVVALIAVAACLVATAAAAAALLLVQWRRRQRRSCKRGGNAVLTKTSGDAVTVDGRMSHSGSRGPDSPVSSSGRLPSGQQLPSGSHMEVEVTHMAAEGTCGAAEGTHMDLRWDAGGVTDQAVEMARHQVARDRTLPALEQLAPGMATAAAAALAAAAAATARGGGDGRVKASADCASRAVAVTGVAGEEGSGAGAGAAAAGARATPSRAVAGREVEVVPAGVAPAVAAALAPEMVASGSLGAPDRPSWRRVQSAISSMQRQILNRRLELPWSSDSGLHLTSDHGLNQNDGHGLPRSSDFGLSHSDHKRGNAPGGSSSLGSSRGTLSRSSEEERNGTSGPGIGASSKVARIPEPDQSASGADAAWQLPAAGVSAASEQLPGTSRAPDAKGQLHASPSMSMVVSSSGGSGGSGGRNGGTDRALPPAARDEEGKARSRQQVLLQALNIRTQGGTAAAAPGGLAGVGAGRSSRGPSDGGGAAHFSSPATLQLVDVVGRGTFSTVYKAVWRGRFVAVKVGTCTFDRSHLV